jgi:hypothetical protein
MADKVTSPCELNRMVDLWSGRRSKDGKVALVPIRVIQVVKLFGLSFMNCVLVESRER